jgi:hypothetical protein
MTSRSPSSPNGGHGWGKDGGPGYGIQFTAMAKLVYDRAREGELALECFQQKHPLLIGEVRPFQSCLDLATMGAH